MKRNTLISMVLLLVGLYSKGQESFYDSLQQRLETSAEAKKPEILWVGAQHASDEDVEMVRSFTEPLLQNPQVQSDSAWYYDVLRIQSDADRWTGHYVRAIEGFNDCYGYFKAHQDTSRLIFCADHLGAMHVFMGYNELAQSYLLEVYDLEKKRKNKADIAGAINGLAIFYNNTGQPEKAVNKYRQALKLYQEAQDTMGQANVHANLGMTLIGLSDFEEAEYHLKMQGKLDTLLGTMWGLGFHFDFMGSLYEAQERHEEAYSYYKQSLEIREALPSKYNINEARASVAESLFELARYREAIATAEKIFEYQDLTQSLSHQERAYGLLSKAHEELGNAKKALDYHKQYKAISDSILNKEILTQVTENDAKFELVEQRANNQILRAENAASQQEVRNRTRMLVLVIIASTVLFLFAAFLFWLARKYLHQKDALSQALADKDVLLREIHHRVKNNLQVVSSLLSLQGRTIDDENALKAINEGKTRVRTMALIHQDLYHQENLMGVNVKTYLTKLCRELFDTYNISDERIALKLDIHISEVDVDTLVPLGLILNELITNCLKYAFPDKRSGEISIQLIEENNQLKLVVADDGIGFDPEKKGKGGFGNRLIRSLSRQLKAEIITDIDPGTSVTLMISKYNMV